MKLQIVSDLHLERFTNKKKLMNFLKSLSGDADYLLLSGDTFSFHDIDNQMKCLSENFKKVIFISGNHEYYHTNIKDMNKLLNLYAKKYNFTFLNNDYIIINDIIIIGGNGWYDRYNESNAKLINDFHLILNFKYDPYLMLDMNKSTKKYFKKIMSKYYGKKKIICMTHCAPLYDFITAKYLYSNLNIFFANNWEDLIKKYKPKIWLSGHTHQSLYFKKFDTTFIENDYGYYDYDTNTKFNKNLILEV